MSSFNVADNKADAKSGAAGSSAANAFNIDDMTAALNVIGGADVRVNIKQEAGVSVNITYADEDDNLPNDDDDKSAKAPKVETAYWQAFYRAGDIKHDSQLKSLSDYEKVKNRVWRNRNTGQLLHDRATILGVHIGTLVDPKFQTGGFVYNGMHVRDCRVHQPWVGGALYGLLGWMTVTCPLNESKGTTCTDGSAQAYRKRIAAAGTKDYVANLMCSTIQRVAAYAPLTRGSRGESACMAICFDFHALVVSHYLNYQTVFGLLQRDLLVWDVSAKDAEGNTQHITVCGVAGLLEIMALSNIRATYGLNQSTDTADKEEGTASKRGKKLLYYKKDNLTGGMFGILYNYLVQGILQREASPASAATAAASAVVDDRLAEAEQRNAELVRRLAESESGRRVANEGLALQTSRVNALQTDNDRLKAEVKRTTGNIYTINARDAKISTALYHAGVTDAQFRAGMKGSFKPPVGMPPLEAVSAASTATAAAPTAAAAAVAPRTASAAAATPRLASNQAAGYPRNGNGMADS
jgi:hypothetical protein